MFFNFHMFCLLVYNYIPLICIWVFACCMFCFKLQSTLTLQKCSINSLLLLLRQDACMCVSLYTPTCTHEIVQLKELAFSKHFSFKKASFSKQVKERKRKKKTHKNLKRELCFKMLQSSYVLYRRLLASEMINKTRCTK